MSRLLTILGRQRQSPLAAFRAMLASQATYAWWGPDATLSSWPDVVAGINAAPGGSGTTLGSLAGIPCPTLNGSGWYRLASGISISTPYSVVVIAQNVGAFGYPFDGATAISSGIRYDSATVVRTRTSVFGPAVTITSGIVVAIHATFNGASGSLRVNNATAAGDTGTSSLSGATIGSDGATANRFTGPIALAAIFDSARAANAAGVASAARALIGV